MNLYFYSNERRFSPILDSFSDNIELSSAAKQLEVALDSIIDAEEQKRT